MPKYDCSKVIDYVHEMKRMCNLYSDYCEGRCPLSNCPDCRFTDELTQEHIEAVQKWSDTHPEKTKKDETDQRNDPKLLTEVISKICNYAVDNKLSPDESLRAISKNILAMLNVASFEHWKSEDKSKEEEKE